MDRNEAMNVSGTASPDMTEFREEFDFMKEYKISDFASSFKLADMSDGLGVFKDTSQWKSAKLFNIENHEKYKSNFPSSNLSFGEGSCSSYESFSDLKKFQELYFQDQTPQDKEVPDSGDELANDGSVTSDDSSFLSSYDDGVTAEAERKVLEKRIIEAKISESRRKGDFSTAATTSRNNVSGLQKEETMTDSKANRISPAPSVPNYFETAEFLNMISSVEKCMLMLHNSESSVLTKSFYSSETRICGVELPQPYRQSSCPASEISNISSDNYYTDHGRPIRKQQEVISESDESINENIDEEKNETVAQKRCNEASTLVYHKNNPVRETVTKISDFGPQENILGKMHNLLKEDSGRVDDQQKLFSDILKNMRKFDEEVDVLDFNFNSVPNFFDTILRPDEDLDTAELQSNIDEVAARLRTASRATVSPQITLLNEAPSMSTTTSSDIRPQTLNRILNNLKDHKFPQKEEQIKTFKDYKFTTEEVKNQTPKEHMFVQKEQTQNHKEHKSVQKEQQTKTLKDHKFVQKEQSQTNSKRNCIQNESSQTRTEQTVVQKEPSLTHINHKIVQKEEQAKTPKKHKVVQKKSSYTLQEHEIVHKQSSYTLQEQESVPKKLSQTLKEHTRVPKKETQATAVLEFKLHKTQSTQTEAIPKKYKTESDICIKKPSVHEQDTQTHQPVVLMRSNGIQTSDICVLDPMEEKTFADAQTSCEPQTVALQRAVSAGVGGLILTTRRCDKSDSTFDEGLKIQSEEPQLMVVYYNNEIISGAKEVSWSIPDVIVGYGYGEMFAVIWSSFKSVVTTCEALFFPDCTVRDYAVFARGIVASSKEKLLRWYLRPLSQSIAQIISAYKQDSSSVVGRGSSHAELSRHLRRTSRRRSEEEMDFRRRCTENPMLRNKSRYYDRDLFRMLTRVGIVMVTASVLQNMVREASKLR